MLDLAAARLAIACVLSHKIEEQGGLLCRRHGGRAGRTKDRLTQTGFTRTLAHPTTRILAVRGSVNIDKQPLCKINTTILMCLNWNLKKQVNTSGKSSKMLCFLRCSTQLSRLQQNICAGTENHSDFQVTPELLIQAECSTQLPSCTHTLTLTEG